MTHKESNFLKANVREFSTKNGKVGWNIDINVKDLERFPVNEHGFARLTMRPRNEKGKYGETHFMVENDFVPEKQEQKNDIDGIPDNGTREDDLPF